MDREELHQLDPGVTKPLLVSEKSYVDSQDETKAKTLATNASLHTVNTNRSKLTLRKDHTTAILTDRLHHRAKNSKQDILQRTEEVFGSQHKNMSLFSDRTHHQNPLSWHDSSGISVKLQKYGITLPPQCHSTLPATQEYYSGQNLGQDQMHHMKLIQEVFSEIQENQAKQSKRIYPGKITAISQGNQAIQNNSYDQDTILPKIENVDVARQKHQKSHSSRNPRPINFSEQRRRQHHETILQRIQELHFQPQVAETLQKKIDKIDFHINKSIFQHQQQLSKLSDTKSLSESEVLKLAQQKFFGGEISTRNLSQRLQLSTPEPRRMEKFATNQTSNNIIASHRKTVFSPLKSLRFGEISEKKVVTEANEAVCTPKINIGFLSNSRENTEQSSVRDKFEFPKSKKKAYNLLDEVSKPLDQLLKTKTVKFGLSNSEARSEQFPMIHIHSVPQQEDKIQKESHSKPKLMKARVTEKSHSKSRSKSKSILKILPGAKTSYLSPHQRKLKKKQLEKFKLIVPKNLLEINKGNNSATQSSFFSSNGTGVNDFLSLELEDFKRNLSFFLNIKDRNLKEKKKEFLEATNNNPCCKVILGLFQYPELVPTLELGKFSHSLELKNGLPCMITDFKKYLLEKKLISLRKVQSDFALSVKKLNMQKSVFKMKRAQENPSLLKQNQDSTVYFYANYDFNDVANLGSNNVVQNSIKNTEQVPKYRLENVSQYWKERQSMICDQLKDMGELIVQPTIPITEKSKPSRKNSISKADIRAGYDKNLLAKREEFDVLREQDSHLVVLLPPSYKVTKPLI